MLGACSKMLNISRDVCVPYKQICSPSMALPRACWPPAADQTMTVGFARGPSADRPAPAGAKDAEDAGSTLKAPFRVLLYSLQRHTYRHELTFSSPVQALRWALQDTSCCCAALLLAMGMRSTHRW